MSVHYSSLIWDIVMPNSGRKLVALALADQANDDGICWPSLRKLASRCQMRPEAIRDHLKHLCAIGIVSREAVFEDNRQTSNTYRFMPLDELRGRVAKIASGPPSENHHPPPLRFSPPRESSGRNRQKESSKGKGGFIKPLRPFSDRNRRPVPESEEQMYELLEAADILSAEGCDGNFFDQMQKSGWRAYGKPLADWMKFYEGRVNKIAPA